MALTDFSDNRPRLFPNLSRNRYRVLELTEHTARAVEGTGPFYTIERYDWSAPDRVWSIVEESNVASPGDLTDVKVQSRTDGGSRIVVNVERGFVGWRGRLLLYSLTINGGTRALRRTYVKVLRNALRQQHKKRAA